MTIFSFQLLVKSDAGVGDLGYSGPNGLVPQTFATNYPNGCGYICYGVGQWDGQGSGKSPNEWGGPSVNNCDGGRSHNYCDYRE